MTSTNGRWRRRRGRIQYNGIERGWHCHWHWHSPPRAPGRSVPKFKAKSNTNNRPFTPPSQNIIVFGKCWGTTARQCSDMGSTGWERRPPSALSPCATLSGTAMSPAHPPHRCTALTELARPDHWWACSFLYWPRFAGWLSSNWEWLRVP